MKHTSLWMNQDGLLKSSMQRWAAENIEVNFEKSTRALFVSSRQDSNYTYAISISDDNHLFG